MRTAQEWLETFHDGSGLHIAEATISAKDIAAIQADALRHAAQLVHDMSRGTKSEDRAIAIDEARDLVLSEATILEP